MESLVGILAFVSLIDDPGKEIADARVRTLKDGITTPFRIEFARTSRTRKGAPTLVPVKNGGALVSAQIHVVKVGEQDATNRLWRRETGKVGNSNLNYARPSDPGLNDVLVDRIENFHDVAVVLYTRIGQNIESPTAEGLAVLAVESARQLANGRDGISYLIAAKRNGITTPLSAAYEEEVKRLTGTRTLEEALAAAVRPPG